MSELEKIGLFTSISKDELIKALQYLPQEHILEIVKDLDGSIGAWWYTKALFDYFTKERLEYLNDELAYVTENRDEIESFKQKYKETKVLAEKLNTIIEQYEVLIK